MVIDRRDELTRQRIQTINRLHRLLAELIPGTTKRDMTALQAKAKLASRTRRTDATTGPPSSEDTNSRGRLTTEGCRIDA
jgi:hypothetical protein